MSLRKFAMLILTIIVISGFCTKPVSAFAKEDENAAPAVEIGRASCRERVCLYV